MENEKVEKLIIGILGACILFLITGLYLLLKFHEYTFGGTMLFASFMYFLIWRDNNKHMKTLED